MGQLKALVTGGAGFIGSHVVAKLVHRGVETTVIDNLSTGKLENLSLRSDFIDFKHDDYIEWQAELIQQFDVVFHLAAQANVGRSMREPIEDARDNYLAVVELARKMRPDQTLIFSSSAGAATERPFNFYGIHKLAAEHALRVMTYAGIGPKVVTLRYANVWGPRQRTDLEGGVVARFADAIERDEKPTIHGDGTQTRDFVHVDVVAQANVNAARTLSGDRYVSYEIGSGVATSVRDVYYKVFEALRGSTPMPNCDFAPLPPGHVHHHKCELEQVQRSCTELELTHPFGVGSFCPTRKLLGY